MIKIIYIFLFICISMLTWCSIFFKIADNIWGEELLFSNIKRGVVTYTVSIIGAILMTLIGYFIIMAMNN